MRDLASWRAELTRAAPEGEPMFNRTLARLLATEADVDALLTVADALDDAVAEWRLYGFVIRAGQFATVARLIRTEVATRSNPRGNFW